ncbi:MAG: CDP-diacylglycerol--glycerol-3-phosphate 3-phosphatidyltransferase, partial [Candidatus Riflebacteria bacterium]
MNLATKLTLMRVIAIPFFILAFSWKNPGSELSGDWGKVIATIIFIIAAITDYYDGYLARRYQQVTTLGRFMDPIADKLLVSTALIMMVEYRSITHTAGWIAVIIIAREFAVTGLRLVCAEKGRVIDASSAGKLKTTAQLTAIITALTLI